MPIKAQGISFGQLLHQNYEMVKKSVNRKLSIQIIYQECFIIIIHILYNTLCMNVFTVACLDKNVPMSQMQNYMHV